MLGCAVGGGGGGGGGRIRRGDTVNPAAGITAMH